jgi:hypothetical protein
MKKGLMGPFFILWQVEKEFIKVVSSIDYSCSGGTKKHSGLLAILYVTRIPWNRQKYWTR